MKKTAAIILILSLLLSAVFTASVNAVEGVDYYFGDDGITAYFSSLTGLKELLSDLRGRTVIKYTGEDTLIISEDTVIPIQAFFGDVTILAGETVIFNDFVTVSGDLIVNGDLVVNKRTTVAGELTVNGSLSGSAYVNTSGLKGDGAIDVTDDDQVLVNVSKSAGSEDELIAALDGLTSVKGVSYSFALTADVDITKNVTIPSGVTLSDYQAKNITVKNGAALTTDEGAYMYLTSGQDKLLIEEGAKFTNNGYVNLTRTAVIELKGEYSGSGTIFMSVDGTATLSDKLIGFENLPVEIISQTDPRQYGSVVMYSMEVRYGKPGLDNLELDDPDDTYYFTEDYKGKVGHFKSFAGLKNLLADLGDCVTIKYDGTKTPFIIREDIILPILTSIENVMIPEGITLTVDAGLNCDEITNYGTVNFNNLGTYFVDYFDCFIFSVKNYGRINGSGNLIIGYDGIEAPAWYEGTGEVADTLRIDVGVIWVNNLNDFSKLLKAIDKAPENVHYNYSDMVIYIPDFEGSTLSEQSAVLFNKWNGDILISDHFTLEINGDVTVSAEQFWKISEGANVIINGSLTVNGSLKLDSEDGLSCLNVNGDLIINGTVSGSGYIRANSLTENGTVTPDEENFFTIEVNKTCLTEDEFFAAMNEINSAEYKEYIRYEITADTDVNVKKDITIPNNCFIIIEAGRTFTVKRGATLTTTEDGIITFYGKGLIESCAKFINNGRFQIVNGDTASFELKGSYSGTGYVMFNHDSTEDTTDKLKGFDIENGEVLRHEETVLPNRTIISDWIALPEVIEDVPPVQTGDANGDGLINNKDVVSLFKTVSSGAVLDESQISVLDFTGDGLVNNKDIVALFKHISNA